MADQDTTSTSSTNPGYADLHEHIERLEAAGLLYRIDEPVNKDTEMHPLVRWQFRGGIPEADRKAFLFTNVVDSKGRQYDIPVVVGGIAANPEIYRIGMNVPSLDDIGDAWEPRDRQSDPAASSSKAVRCMTSSIEGDDLEGPGNGLESLPMPISTPGFDAAPYMTMTGVIIARPGNRRAEHGHLSRPPEVGRRGSA